MLEAEMTFSLLETFWSVVGVLTLGIFHLFKEFVSKAKAVTLESNHLFGALQLRYCK